MDKVRYRYEEYLITTFRSYKSGEVSILSDFSPVIQKNKFETKKRHLDRRSHIEVKGNEIPQQYQGDIRRYLEYCSATDQLDSTDAMLDYLYSSLMEQKVKKTTWERRLAAIKKHLLVMQKIDFNKESEVANELSVMRKIYMEEQNAYLIKVEGKSAVDKPELLKLISNLPIREKAICLVNLITANRPNEMVRMKIRDFNLSERTVDVYLTKQKQWHTKRLTPEVVKVIEDYTIEYRLKPDNYFVGRVYKNGRYENTEITEQAFTKSLQKWTGLTGYNFRKSQVVAMHEAGADLATIAKQTGHKSLETLVKHYLSVSGAMVDKYL